MENQEVKEILEYLKKDLTRDEKIEAIRGLGDTSSEEARIVLTKMLEDFDNLSWKERNAIAMALGDLGFDESVPILMKVVLDTKYNGYNGTFLYALTTKPMACKEYFLDFVRLLCAGDLEIREAAITLIETFYKEVSIETIKESLRILSSEKILLEARYEGNEEYGTIGYIEHIQDLLSSR